MANLNDTMASGRGTKWRNKIGNELTTGDIVDEIKSDAIFMELENFDKGASLLYFVSIGQEVPTVIPLALLENWEKNWHHSSRVINAASMKEQQKCKRFI